MHSGFRLSTGSHACMMTFTTKAFLIPEGRNHAVHALQDTGWSACGRVLVRFASGAVRVMHATYDDTDMDMDGVGEAGILTRSRSCADGLQLPLPLP